MAKDEIIVRLKEMLDEAENNIKKFEETKNFDYISEYNIYTIKDLFKELIGFLEDKED